ncbi:hypothetical protein ACYCFK_17895 [Stutzerimonas stutzeri]
MAGLTGMGGSNAAVNQAYQDLLGRDADPTGLGIYGPLVNKGMTADSLRSAIMASKEYGDNNGVRLIDSEAAFRGDQGASEVLGQLYRAQWEDWKTRFSPYIDRLAELSSDKTYAAGQGASAAAAVNTSYTNAARGLQMQRAGMGINQTEAQKGAEQRQLSLGRAADSASAYNEAKISARDMQDQILAGGMGLKNIPNTGQMQQE